MTVTIGVVADIRRQHMAEQLAAHIRADYVSFDDGTLGPNRNHRVVWTELAHIDSTYGVVVEDDTVVIRDFRHQLEQALKASPSPIISGYLGKQRPPQWMPKVASVVQAASAADSHYILSSHLLHGVCVAIQHEHIQPMLDFTATRNYLPWDEAVSAYARHAGQPVTYLWPSICDHRDGESLIKHRDGEPRPPGRVAWKVGHRHTWSGDRIVTM